MANCMTIGVRSSVRLLVCAGLLTARIAGDGSVPRGSVAAEAPNYAAHDTELRGDTGNWTGGSRGADSLEIGRAFSTRPPLFIAREWE
jgi:hypothetical protein